MVRYVLIKELKCITPYVSVNNVLEKQMKSLENFVTFDEMKSCV